MDGVVVAPGDLDVEDIGEFALAPGAPLLAALALAAGLAARSLPRLVLGLQLIPPGVVSRSASLLLESGDGFGRKPLELRALVVEVLEGALTLEEADGAVARGASGRGSTASVVPAPSVPRGVCRC